MYADFGKTKISNNHETAKINTLRLEITLIQFKRVSVAYSYKMCTEYSSVLIL